MLRRSSRFRARTVEGRRDPPRVRVSVGGAVMRVVAGLGALAALGTAAVAVFAVVAMVAFASMPSCEVDLPDAEAGAVETPEGVQLVPPTCVTSLAWIEVREAADDGDGRPVWQLQADGEAPARPVTIGTAPTGFTENVALTAALPTRLTVTLVGFAGHTLVTARLTLALADLRPDAILTSSGLLDLPRFAALPCPVATT
jgi:hypothetical protein